MTADAKSILKTTSSLNINDFYRIEITQTFRYTGYENKNKDFYALKMIGAGIATAQSYQEKGMI